MNKDTVISAAIAIGAYLAGAVIALISLRIAGFAGGTEHATCLEQNDILTVLRMLE